jgi:hypothetical protein
VTPLSPDLTDAFLCLSVAALARTAFVWTELAGGVKESAGELCAWQTTALGLTSVTLVSAGDASLGAFAVAVAGVLAVPWLRERLADGTGVTRK